MQHTARNNCLGRMVEPHIEVLQNAPPSLEKPNSMLHRSPPPGQRSIERVLRRGAGGIRRERREEERKQRVGRISDDVWANVVAADSNNRVTEDVRRGESAVEEAVAEVGGIIGTAGGLDTDVPEDVAVVGDGLEEDGGWVTEFGGVEGGEAGESDGGAVNGARDIGEGGEVLEGVDDLEEALAGGDLDEVWVELGGEEAGDHVGGLGEEGGWDGVAAGEDGAA